MIPPIPKKPIKRRSAKAKGRSFEKAVVTAFLTAFPDLTEDDVRSVAASVKGEDIIFSERARERLGVSVECKRRAKIAVYEWHDQCGRNAAGHVPVTVIRADKKKPLALVDLDHFLDLLVRARCCK